MPTLVRCVRGRIDFGVTRDYQRELEVASKLRLIEKLVKAYTKSGDADATTLDALLDKLQYWMSQQRNYRETWIIPNDPVIEQMSRVDYRSRRLELEQIDAQLKAMIAQAPGSAPTPAEKLQRLHEAYDALRAGYPTRIAHATLNRDEAQTLLEQVNSLLHDLEVMEQSTFVTFDEQNPQFSAWSSWTWTPDQRTFIEGVKTLREDLKYLEHRAEVVIAIMSPEEIVEGLTTESEAYYELYDLGERIENLQDTYSREPIEPGSARGVIDEVADTLDILDVVWKQAAKYRRPSLRDVLDRRTTLRKAEDLKRRAEGVLKTSQA